jgi:hypothetical protein
MSGKVFKGAHKIAQKVGGKTLGRLAGKAGRTAVQTLNPLEVLREYYHFRKATEQEVTRREEIRAKRDVAIATIQTERELIEKYFQHRFAERASALSEFFNLLDHAVDTRNDNELDVALNGILAVVKDSPLKDFESFRAARIEGRIIEI